MSKTKKTIKIRALCPGCQYIREAEHYFQSSKDKKKRYKCSSCGWQIAELYTE